MTHKYSRHKTYSQCFVFHFKGLPDMNTFPDIGCHVGGYSDVEHDETHRLRYLAGDLLGNG